MIWSEKNKQKNEEIHIRNTYLKQSVFNFHFCYKVWITVVKKALLYQKLEGSVGVC